MRAGIKQGYTLPSVVLADVDQALTPHVVDDPTKSLLYEPFTQFPDSFSEADRERLAAAGKAAIGEHVVPGYRTLLEFLTSEYVPNCREQIGASALPNGREFYRHRVRHHTTLDVDPQNVHDIGLAEVKRIKAEMQDVIRRTGFKGDFAAFVEFLRTDPQFYADTPEQLLKETSLVLKRMDGELPKLFGKLPRTPYGIREIPDFIAPRTTTAYYQPPAGDGTRGGLLLRQHLQSQEPAAVRDRGAFAARSGAGTPPADRLAAGDRRAAHVPPLLPTPRRLSKAGGCMPNGWAWRSASTRIPTATSAG